MIFFVLLGARAVALMKGAQKEVARRQPKVAVYALRLLAALLVIDAIANLVL